VPYGSTSPAFTPPLTDRVKIESLNLECSPCFERECPLQHGNCMKQLSCEKIDAALADLMQQQSKQHIKQHVKQQGLF